MDFKREFDCPMDALCDLFWSYPNVSHPINLGDMETIDKWYYSMISPYVAKKFLEKYWSQSLSIMKKTVVKYDSKNFV